MSKQIKPGYPLNVVIELFELSKLDKDARAAFIDNIDINAFEHCLSGLDPTQFAIIEMKYNQNISIKQSGPMMGISPSTASKEKVRAFELLKNRYNKSKYMKD